MEKLREEVAEISRDVAVLNERQKTTKEDVGDIESRLENYSKRIAEMEKITSRNAVVVSYLERIGWGVMLATVSMFTFIKNFFSGEGH